jgi:hypothetical protein
MRKWLSSLLPAKAVPAEVLRLSLVKRQMERELRAQGHSKRVALEMIHQHFSKSDKGNKNVAQ